MHGVGQQLLEVLREHGIRSERDLRMKYDQWGSDRILSFVREIAAIEDQPVSHSGALTIAPIGGCLGLGRANEFLRQLLLYSDRVLVFNDLTSVARMRLARRPDRLWKATEAKALLGGIYPYLHQLLWSRTAVESGSLLIGPASAAWMEPTDAADSAALDRLISDAPNDYTRFGILANGQPYASFGTGERELALFGGMMIAYPEVRVGSPPTSTTPGLMRNFMPEQDWEPLDKDEFANRFPDDWDRYKQLVGQEFRRLSSALELAVSSNACLMSDRDEDVRLFTSVIGTDVGPHTQPEVATFQIAEAIEFLDRVSLDDLIRLRDSLSNEFDKFRVALLELSQNLDRTVDSEERQRNAERIVRDLIRPALADIAQKMRAERSERIKSGAVVVVTAALTLSVALLSGQQLATLAELAALPSLSRALENRTDAQYDPFFFLYKLHQGEH